MLNERFNSIITPYFYTIRFEMKAASLNHSTISWIYTFSIAILAAALLSAAASADTYTLTTRVKPNEAGVGGLPAGTTYCDLTSDDTIVVTAANAQIWLTAGATLNCNIDISGISYGSERTGKIRLQGTNSSVSHLTGVVNLLGDTAIGSHAPTGAYGTLYFDNQITGDGGLIVAAGTAAPTYLNASPSSNNYKGNTQLGHPEMYKNGGTQPYAGTLYLNANEQIPDANTAGADAVGNLVMNSYSGQISKLYLNGHTETVNGLVSADTTYQSVISGNGDSKLIVGANNATASYSGLLQGEMSFEKIGSGAQTLAGVNTYTGTTTVTAGTLTLAAANAIATSSSVASAGAITMTADQQVNNLSGSGTFNGGNKVLTINATGNATYAGKMSNISKIIVTGNGAWTFQDTVSNETAMTNVGGIDVVNGATFNFTGSADHFAHGLLYGKPFFIQNATMTTSVPHGTNESPITLDHGTLTFKASGFINSYLHNVTMKNGSTINGSASGTYCRTNYQHDSTIRTQYVDGTPKDVLNTISVGVQSYGNKTLTLDVAEFAPLTISGAITQDGGTATLKKTGAGLLTLSSSASSFTGGFTISGGEVKVTGGWNSSAKTSPLGKLQNRTITVNNGALLTLNAQDILTNAHNDTGIKVVLDNGKIANEGPYYNAILDLTVKNGAQIYATDGNSTWKAFKLHNVSVVRSGDAVAAAPVVFAADMNQPNATYAFGAKSSDVATAASVINVADITSASVSELDNLSDLIISGVVADAITVNTGVKTAGPITKTGAGILEFTAANTYSGPTTIQEGVIRLSGNGTLGTGTVEIDENGTLNYFVDEDATRTVEITNVNKIFGTGSVTKTGDGVLKINNEDYADSFSTGAFNVEAGELHFKGNLEGDLIVRDGALYSPGNSVGETNVLGNVLIDGGTILFEFEAFPGADADANHDFLTVSDDKTFTAGDNMVALYFDGDPQNWATVGGEYRLVANGSFAQDDYSNWLSNYTDLFGLSGKADGLYLVSLAAPGPQPEPGSGVPEPSTWALLALGAAGLLYWRKRK